MGFAPSLRRRGKKGPISTELPIIPFINLFMCIVPLLLIAASFQKISVLSLFLPTVEEASISVPVPGSDLEDFTLAVVVSTTELSLRRDDAVVYRASIVGEKMDLPALAAALRGVKRDNPRKRDVILMVDGSVLYDTIVQVMDAVRGEGGRSEMFPDISLADRVVEVR